RPGRVVGVGGIECNARRNVTREVFEPEISRVSDGVYDAPAVVRGPRIPDVSFRAERVELLSGPVEPGQLELVDISAGFLIGEDSVVRNGKDGREESGIFLHVSDDREGLARELP